MVAFFNSTYFHLKTYNKTNFFKHTFCEFTEVNKNFFEQNPVHFKSKTGSFYSYTEEGIYRYSNHWGRVANCRWKLITAKKYKNQAYYSGFAKWSDFYALHESEKQFYISVDFDKKTVDFHHKENRENEFLYTSIEAQKKVQQIRILLKEEKWATYFDENIEVLRKKIISEFINSNKSLQQIKREQK